jgi:hypothetical protein
MTISNTPIPFTDFIRISHDYQTYPSPRLTSAGFSMTVEAMDVFDIVIEKPAEVSEDDGCV